MNKMKRVGCLVIAGLLGFSLWLFCSFFSKTTFAAPVDFPKKEITIIVPFGPGGGRDIIARGVGKTMSKYLGVPIVVVNMPGAGGARGLINLYHSAPDGYTIGVGQPTDIIDQIIEKRDYDNKKFTYIGRAQAASSFWFVKPDSPFRSVKDFKTFGKPLRFSAFSLTAPSTVAAMVFANREGFPLVVVGGYQGGAAAALGLVRGEVEFYGGALTTAKPFLDSKQIRPILTFGASRDPGLPDVPTIGEVGYPDMESLSIDYWFMASPGVPKTRAQILEDALMKTLKDPEFLEWAKGAGVDPGPLGSEGLTKMVFSLFGILEKYKEDINKYIKK